MTGFAAVWSAPHGGTSNHLPFGASSVALLDRFPILYLYCNWRSNGWSEKYHLPPMDWAEALQLGAQIARWRIAASCRETRLIWGRIAYADDRTLTAPLPNIGIEAIPRAGIGAGGPHTVFTRLHYRFETAGGDWGDRLFAGIPDDAVGPDGTTADLQPLQPGEVPADPSDPAASWALTMRSCVSFLLANTRFATRKGVADPGLWRVEPWTKAVFRRPSTRNIGRDFRRVTWLPAMTRPADSIGVDPPWDAAPAFNPCGAAVGVTRSAYSRACRWYVNGPIGRIRYAFVDECAKILPYPTRFWPFKDVMDLVNVAGTGEVTADPGPWSSGRRRSRADGSHPVGSAADFAGASPVPWEPATPTPLESIPCCAFGETTMEAIEYVRVCVDDLTVAVTAAGGILTSSSNALLPDLDGRTLVKKDRLLYTPGTARAGIYEVLDVGADDPGGRPFRLQRLQTCDGTATYNPGQVVKVYDGDDRGHQLWELQTEPPYVLDTTVLDFAELAGGGGADKTGVVKIVSGNQSSGYAAKLQTRSGGNWVDGADATVKEVNDRVLRVKRRYLAHKEADFWYAWNTNCADCDPPPKPLTAKVLLWDTDSVLSAAPFNPKQSRLYVVQQQLTLLGITSHCVTEYSGTIGDYTVIFLLGVKQDPSFMADVNAGNWQGRIVHASNIPSNHTAPSGEFATNATLATNWFNAQATGLTEGLDASPGPSGVALYELYPAYGDPLSALQDPLQGTKGCSVSGGTPVYKWSDLSEAIVAYATKGYVQWVAVGDWTVFDYPDPSLVAANKNFFDALATVSV